MINFFEVLGRGLGFLRPFFDQMKIFQFSLDFL